MPRFRPKKSLAQHFLKDEAIARRIVDSLTGKGYSTVLEIGAGKGILTKFLLEDTRFTTYVNEIDTRAVSYLRTQFPQLKDKIIEADFLKLDITSIGRDKRLSIIGNFPYHISSQILFKIYEHHHLVQEMVGMFQKEVAERIAASPGGKAGGILSVLMQAYYEVEYLFTVEAESFYPPPKVRSAVIRLTRNSTKKLNCDEVLFKQVVKTAFNQRRKMLSNALKPLLEGLDLQGFPHLKKRAEELTVEHFIELTNLIGKPAS